MLKLVRYLLAIGALYAPFSLVWAADPVCVETGGRKICYSAAADRVTPQTFDLSMRGMCHVATDTGAVTEWTGTAYISSATCPGSAGGTSASSLGKAEDAAHNSGDTGVAVLFKRCDTAASSSGTDGDYTVPCLDSSGRIWVTVSNASDYTTDDVTTYPAVITSEASAQDVDQVGTKSVLGGPLDISRYSYCTFNFLNTDVAANATIDEVNIYLLVNDQTIAESIVDYTEGNFAAPSGALESVWTGTPGSDYDTTPDTSLDEGDILKMRVKVQGFSKIDIYMSASADNAAVDSDWTCQ